MRRERLAATGFWLGFGAALCSNACSDSPGQIFASAGSAGVGGGIAAHGGASAGSANGGAPTSGAGGTAGVAGAGLGGTGGKVGLGGAGGTVAGSGGTAGSAGAPAGGKGGTGGVGGGNLPSEIVQKITMPTDDCTWIQRNGQYEERLRYSDAQTWLEVGSDAEQGRIGLRFALPIPARATIVSASLQLQRVDGDAQSTDTLSIQVYDSGNVPPFDAMHRHGPAAHTSGGLFGTAINGTLVGENGKLMTSADLKILVQRVVDRSDFAQSGMPGTIGFVISPQVTNSWVGYGDSSTGNGATLRVSYRPPGG